MSSNNNITTEINSTVLPVLPNITTDELLYGTGKFDKDTGKEIMKLSPTKAANAILEKCTLAMRENDETIYIFDGKIYRKNGVQIIEFFLKNAVGDKALKYARSEVLALIRIELSLHPVIFDPYPNLLGCQNGVLELDTGTFRDYKKEDYITDPIPVTYNPDATCPEISKFINSITPIEADHETLFDILASGAYRKALMFIGFIIGHGSTGSSQYVHLIEKFYGAKSIEGLSLREVSEGRFALSNLENARFSIVNEVESVNASGTGKIKEISGGDRISSDVKYEKNRCRYLPFTKMLFKGNSIPKFADASYGFKRRYRKTFLPYKFVSSVDSSKLNQRQDDPKILEKMTTPEELSGLLNIIAKRMPGIIALGKIPDRHPEQEEEDEETLINSVTTFFELFCDDDGYDMNISTTELFEKFTEWANLTGGNLENRYRFRHLITTLLGRKPMVGKLKVKDSTLKVEDKTVRGFPGLTFNKADYDITILQLSKELIQ